METKFVVSCLKIFLLIYCFGFWSTGVILLVFGVWGQLTLGVYLSLLAIDVPTVLIGTGIVIIIFGLFGCFSTCRGSPRMLKLYSLFLSLVFLAELAASISGVLLHREIKNRFLKIYTNAVRNYNSNDRKSQAVDQVQYSLMCCGVKNYTDWNDNPYFLNHGIPPSCCKDEADCSLQDRQNLTAVATKVNQRGCYVLMVGFLEANMVIIIGVLFTVTFSQLIGVRLSCCLSRLIMTQHYETVCKVYQEK
ncbi:similar to Transmembrane 4 superfamily member 2 (Cell surface glycoprotein A15) (PE31) (TALLA homolog) [Mus musculus]|jgi:tetraspanin-7|nr:similar to Transmembrane 4 superfamily member 2 (Cell surface glycoprotein A15) (PE31) (TALLA homolog) [Mus musculus]